MDEVEAMAMAYTVMRDLSDTPALSLGPAELQEAATSLMAAQGVTDIKAIVGTDDLIANNYAMIAAVGMASSHGREPRILDFRWEPPRESMLNQGGKFQGAGDKVIADENNIFQGKSEAQAMASALPEVVIIGKGVVFDTGGLNIKSAGGMRNMKKDMSGAAQVICILLSIIYLSLFFPVSLFFYFYA
jgi:leucyl aminopeptidase